jgi:hypothetical protein
MSTIEEFLTVPVDFDRAVLVFDEQQEIWANCKYLRKTGEIYGVELNASNYMFPLDSAFLWRMNGEKMKVVLKGHRPYAFEPLPSH